MNRSVMKQKSNMEKAQWEKPGTILLTRNKPEKAALKNCCSANMSLLDGGCNQPLRG